MTNRYDKNGFILIEKFLNATEVESIAGVVTRFHEKWVVDNYDFYLERAVNSAFLTGTKYLEEKDRIKLFEFVSTNKFMRVVSALPFSKPAFMNTQLFFDPVNPDQKNYWHRDGQYHLSLEEQKQALDGGEVMHFRVALKDEPGVELVPGSHRRWDSEEELDIRLENSGNRNYQDLSTGISIAIKKGDLLVFSGNIIHRGLYGNDRLSLDVLFCEAQPEYFRFADIDCIPDESIIKRLENPVAMKNAAKIMSERDRAVSQ